MKTTIDRDGRIMLATDVQKRLGVQPGDDVILESRGNEFVLKAANSETGLAYEGNVLVHRGSCTEASEQLAADRDERMEQLSQGIRQ
jgi:bifunctional DNA-binding transcriptional regulator/antitoxin component of YhaV-PrlF toxin-antitoxin module